MKQSKQVFQSSFTRLPDSLILLFRIFDILMSMLLIFVVAVCILGIIAGVSTAQVPAPFFTIVFLAISFYSVLMVYGLCLDFLAGGMDSFQINQNNIVIKKRSSEKTELDLADMKSLTIIKIRLFTSYAYYALLKAKNSRSVIEVSVSDFDNLATLLPKYGFEKERRLSIPMFVAKNIFYK